MHPQRRRRAFQSDKRGTRPRKARAARLSPQTHIAAAGGARPRRARATRRFPQGLIAAAGGWRLRPLPHHSLLGVVIGACVVLALAVIIRLLRTASMRRRRYGATLTPVGRAVPRRAVVLASPGAWDSAALTQACAAMARCGLQVLDRISVRDTPQLARLLAHEYSQPLLVIAAGGDGTVSAAADLIADTDHALGLLPLGTSNDVARSLALPLDPPTAAMALGSGTLCTIDAGQVIAPGLPARHFVHAATAGVNSVFARHAASPGLRNRFGRLAYPLAALVALHQYQPFDCSLRIDDAPALHLRLAHLAVVNAPVFGGPLDLRLNGARIDDQMLDVVAIEHLRTRHLIRAALYTLAGVPRPVHGMHTWRARRVAVHTDAAVDVTVDGEIAASLPATFAVCDGALNVVVPAAASLHQASASWNSSRRNGQPSTPINRGPAGTAA